MARQYQGDIPTNWELFRALESYRNETNRKLASLDALVSEKLVGRDYYHARDESLDERVKVLEQDKRDDMLFRRAMIVALSAAFITALVSLILTIIQHHG
jgi:hypothetical protein